MQRVRDHLSYFHHLCGCFSRNGMHRNRGFASFKRSGVIEKSLPLFSVSFDNRVIIYFLVLYTRQSLPDGKWHARIYYRGSSPIQNITLGVFKRFYCGIANPPPGNWQYVPSYISG
jgi:hypothetical protein